MVACQPLQAAALAQRRRHLRAQRAKLQRLRWLHPDLAWTIDATEYPKDCLGHRLLHVVVHDLGRSFQFEPLLTRSFDGHAVAQFLRRLFTRHGPPRWLKRHNGGNCNTPEVNALLAHFAVLPLNSPVRCRRYNGAVEHSIAEVKAGLPQCLNAPTR